MERRYFFPLISSPKRKNFATVWESFMKDVLPALLKNRNGALGKVNWKSSFYPQSMRKIIGIARYTFIEILRNKIWYVLVLFSGILIISTLLLGTLAQEQKARMITDLGLATIEAITL